MRIAHVANFYGPQSGGLRTTMLHLASGYREQGHLVMLIVPDRRYTSESTPFGYRVTVPSIPIPFSGGYRIIVRLGIVRRTLAGFAPHVVEVSDRFTLVSLGRWARSHEVKSTVFSHETLEGLLRTIIRAPRVTQTLSRWWNKRLSQSFDWVVATTQFAAREFREIEIQNLKVIPLGVDLTQFHPARQDFDLRSRLADGADFVVVHCGRLSPEKCPERSIDMIRHLTALGKNVRLVVAGDGPLRKKLEQRAEGLPITFLGFVHSRDDLAALLASVDVAVAPGPLETFCLAALESLASGTPVVASESSAVREVIGNDLRTSLAGRVVSDDALAFALAVLDLVGNDEEARRQHSRARAERFPWWLTVEHLVVGYRSSEGLARAS